MLSPLMRIPAVIPGTSGLVIDSSKLSAMFPPVGGVEIEAAGHWLLGGNASSLMDLRFQLPLTPIDNQMVPSYGNGYITLAGSSQRRNGLATPIADSAEQTIVLVYRYSASDNAIHAGAFIGSGDGAGGDGLYSQQGAEMALARANPEVQPVPVGLPSGVTAGSWVFAAIGSTSQGASLSRNFIGGGGHADVALNKVVTPRKIALGNGYWTSLFNDGVTVAEFIVFPRILSVAELTALYARSKARLAPRGIAVL